MINFGLASAFNQAYITHHGSQAYLINHGEMAYHRANLNPVDQRGALHGL